MKSQPNSFPFIFLIDRTVSSVPMHRQIYEKMRQAILSGELPAKSRIPSSRDLAAQLGVSRMTIVNAFDQLFAEGYLVGKIGAGTFVADALPEDLLHTPTTKNEKKEVFLRELNLSKKGKQMAQAFADVLCEHSTSNFAPFQNGVTALDSFPFDAWTKMSARVQRKSLTAVEKNDELAGYRPLREAIAAHLKTARGVICKPEQVIITSGAQQALSLIAAVFLEPGDEVWLEDPGYVSARNLFGFSGVKIVPVPVDEDGMNFPTTIIENRYPKLIYVTPSHQYPLGVTMSVARRLSLLETARRAGAWIIEDDYDSEYRYGGHPLASLQGLDRDGRVLYVGTFSKTIFPSLKLGCLVVPPDLTEIFTSARILSGAHSPLVAQATLAEFITEGYFARHLRRMRTLYEKRQQILLEEVRRNLSGIVEMKSSNCGMHLIGWLPAELDETEISRKAALQNIRLQPISDSSINKYPRGGLVFGYAAFDENQIKSGIEKLTKILAEMTADQKDSVKAKNFDFYRGNPTRLAVCS